MFGPYDDVPGFENFVLKVDDLLVEHTVAEQLPRMQHDVARVLDIEPDHLILNSLDNGCFLIKFLLPSDIVDEVFPLCPARIDAFFFLKPRVISIECCGALTSIHSYGGVNVHCIHVFFTVFVVFSVFLPLFLLCLSSQEPP